MESKNDGDAVVKYEQIVVIMTFGRNGLQTNSLNSKEYTNKVHRKHTTKAYEKMDN